MSFTYTPDLHIPLNFIRFKLNDTDSQDYLFQDEEISYFISQLPEGYTAIDLLKICSMLLRQELRRVALLNSKEVAGRDTVERADIDSLKFALDLIDQEIKGNSRVALVSPSYGGVFVREVEENRESDALVDAKFYHGRVPSENARSCEDNILWH